MLCSTECPFSSDLLLILEKTLVCKILLFASQFQDIDCATCQVFPQMPECRFGLQVVRRFWIKNDARGAVEAMKKMTDHSVIISNSTVFFDGHAIQFLPLCPQELKSQGNSFCCNKLHFMHMQEIHVLSRLHQQIQFINIIVSVLCYSNWLLSTLVLQVLVDVLSVLMERTELLTLEICCMLIPLLNGLLASDQDRYLISADFKILWLCTWL